MKDERNQALPPSNVVYRPPARKHPKPPVAAEEIKAMSAAMEYMDKADPRSRARFMFHLTDRYFPEGNFHPVSPPIRMTNRDAFRRLSD